MVEPPTTGPKDSAPVQILFGKYIIHSLLGMGGMAEIYRASASGPGGFEKPVVIKRVRSQYAESENFVQMFVDEARICASLDHANIVSVFDFGEEDGHYFMAMELVDGLDLRTAHVRYAQRHGTPFPWEVSTVVVHDALVGLDYAHKLTGPDGRPLGIVHRDIDLANIMVRRDGAVKVLDFGCAKASSAIRRTQTVAGIIKGKLGYMSPEQADDRPLDGRSDVFAASIVLHELLTGRRLFYGDDPLAIVQSVLNRPIPDPRLKNPNVPARLVEVVLKGLARDPDQRYESAAAMAADLEGLIHEHRLSNARVAEVFAPLIAETGGALGAAITQDQQRRLTLAAWEESTGSAEPLEIISGVLVDDGESSTADAPFIDATIVVTNPRWMLDDAPDTEPDQAPAVGVHAEETQLLADSPQAGLHAVETQLLADPQTAPPAAPVVEAEDLGGQPTIPMAPHEHTAEIGERPAVELPAPHGRTSHLHVYVLVAVVSIVAGVLIFWALSS